jgi:Pin2-interacting protein X1
VNYALDDTKIGQKLLEKMGWAKGKGLGREEQGDLEPIRLKYKNDAEGVGYEVKDDQWVSHREEFNNILSALNGNQIPIEEAEPIPIKSLEVRSKSSKSRVHYHKFTRGKDLSRYSASDMACILGKRANAEINQVKEEIKKEEPIESSNGSVEHLHGVTTIQRGSIQEYFASKMAAVKEKQLGYLANGEQNASLNDSTNGEKRVRINEDLNIVKEFCSKEKILKSNQMTGGIMWMITSKFGYCLLEMKKKLIRFCCFRFQKQLKRSETRKRRKSSR